MSADEKGVLEILECILQVEKIPELDTFLGKVYVLDEFTLWMLFTEY